MKPRARQACGLLLTLALAGCSRDEPIAPVITIAPAAARAVSQDDDLTLILPDLMDLLVDPAAGVLFAATDQPVRADPLSAQAWQAVADAASQLARTSETLASPALAKARNDWLQWTAAMRDGAAAASAAAQRLDPPGLVTAGLQVRSSCLACHTRYAAHRAELLAPHATRSMAAVGP